MSVARLHIGATGAAPVPGGEYALPEAAAHHAARVLRLRTGDRVTLFTGAGGEYGATIAHVDRRGVLARVDAFDAVEREAPLAVTLAQGIAASDAMEYALRKSVELGVAAVQPLVTARSAPQPDGERAAQRLARWRQIAIAACEQCGRNRVPDVRPPQPLAGWLAARDVRVPALLLVPEGDRALATLSPPATALDVVAGPEGGFDAPEVAAARAAGALAVRLGPRVLRAETAGPAALAAINALWGDFR